ncbi:hypothetical protein [Acinetobacter baumannii]|nr:hypothetical protein [Acinetobacter baumannii]
MTVKHEAAGPDIRHMNTLNLASIQRSLAVSRVNDLDQKLSLTIRRCRR